MPLHTADDAKSVEYHPSPTHSLVSHSPQRHHSPLTNAISTSCGSPKWRWNFVISCRLCSVSVEGGSKPPDIPRGNIAKNVKFYSTNWAAQRTQIILSLSTLKQPSLCVMREPSVVNVDTKIRLFHWALTWVSTFFFIDADPACGHMKVIDRRKMK